MLEKYMIQISKSRYVQKRVLLPNYASAKEMLIVLKWNQKSSKIQIYLFVGV